MDYLNPETDVLKQRGVGRRLPEDMKSALEGTMTDEQLEFLQAIEKYKQTHHIRYLKNTDYLFVFKALGYRKVKMADKNLI